MPFPRWTKCIDFRYFDNRDLMGFVDGTENPRGEAAADAVVVVDGDGDFAGGSYVIVQKYLHDLGAWNALSTEAQERIIGKKIQTAFKKIGITGVGWHTFRHTVGPCWQRWANTN
jgi:Dyp-type peroxidase family